MADYITIALDAMGGDYAPAEQIKGAVQALKEHEDMKLIITGKEDMIMKELSAYDYDKNRVVVENATETIENTESPTQAIMKKKDSSMVKAFKMVREGQASAVVSCGSTGAVLTGGMVIVGKIKGVRRAALAIAIPTKTGVAVLIDCGAGVDAKPEALVSFAKMGSIYMENNMGIKNPRVGLVNIGEEEEKGNALTKETFPLLRECEGINFIGNVESRDIPYGKADVLVCDAFTGNIILKMYEGVADLFQETIKKSIYSSLKTKIGGLLIQKSLKKSLKAFSTKEYGGAPLLGLKGLVVKAHGNSDANAIRIALGQCYDFVKNDITNIMVKNFSKEAVNADE